MHCLKVAITTPEGESWGYPYIKISPYQSITQPAQERLATPPGSTSSAIFLEQWCEFFYVTKNRLVKVLRDGTYDFLSFSEKTKTS